MGQFGMALSRTARAYRFPFVLQLLGIIFGLVMYFFLGRLVQPAANPALRGYNADYFAFVLVGLAFLTRQASHPHQALQ